MWTHFWDMSSGGRRKLDWNHIYIEANEEQATSIFYSRFNRNPNRVTCTCCGADYSISSQHDLAQITAFQRNCTFDKVTNQYAERGHKLISLEDYLNSDSVKVIYEDDIQEYERYADVPTEGYVWQ